MRTALLLLTLTLFGAPTFAASLTPPATTTTTSTILSAATPTEKPPRKRDLFKEKKGTMGFVVSLLFGPVGYLSVRLFSHNEMVRYKAKKGIMIWAGIATAFVVLWISTVTKNDNLWYTFWDSLAQGGW